MVTGKLPSEDEPWAQSFIETQIDSLRNLCDEIDTFQIDGHKIFKHLDAILQLETVADKYDLIHAHYGLYGLDAYFSKRNTPLIISFMGSDLLGTPDFNGKLIPYTRIEASVSRWLSRHSDAVIVKSKEMAEVIPSVNTQVIPNGVDIERFFPTEKEEARNILGWDLKQNYVLFPGDPNRPEKNFRLADTIIKSISAHFSYGITLISLVGIEPDLVPVYMNAVDMLLLTSLSEGSPNVIKEAMACCTPIVSVPVGDVEDNISFIKGCYLASFEIMDLAKTTEICLSDGIAKTDGRRVLLEKDLTLTAVAKRIYHVYEQALKG